MSVARADYCMRMVGENASPDTCGLHAHTPRPVLCFCSSFQGLSYCFKCNCRVKISNSSNNNMVYIVPRKEALDVFVIIHI